MKRLTAILCSLLLALACPPCAVAQSQAEAVALVSWSDFSPPLDNLLNFASEIENTLARDKPEAAPLLKSIKADTGFLLDRWNADTSSGPKAYHESLIRDASLLKGVIEKKPPAGELLSVLQDVADDLRIKAAHCEKSPEGWASLIDVTVRTLKDGGEVKNLEVWFVPKGWANVSERWERFSRLSSPTNTLFAPGRYMMWVKGAQPVPVRIGGDGKNQQGVDLVAP